MLLGLGKAARMVVLGKAARSRAVASRAVARAPAAAVAPASLGMRRALLCCVWGSAWRR